MTVFENRVDRLRRILNKEEAMLITNEKNIFYFTGFSKSEGALIVTNNQVFLLVDFRYYEAACNKAKSCEVLQYSNLITSLMSILKDSAVKSVHIEASYVTVNDFQRYVSAMNELGISVISNSALDNMISNLRMMKSKDEIEYITKAQRISERAYNEVLNYIKPGVEERAIANELEFLMKKYGAEDISFDLITITGKKTSLPHGVPDDSLISAGDFFTMDIGAIFNGYHSDMTRTVAVRECSDKQREIYDIVLNAQQSALKLVKSGVESYKVDKMARDIIEEAGYGDCFGHSTGHGVGLDIHENPTVSPKSSYILSDGMVITIEPGIYLNNQFGVRIEDMILVQLDTYHNFATLSKELIIV